MHANAMAQYLTLSCHLLPDPVLARRHLTDTRPHGDCTSDLNDCTSDLPDIHGVDPIRDLPLRRLLVRQHARLHVRVGLPNVQTQR